ncbi:MAG: hypothetical protein M1598_00605 [Actinobacteria bacterium]|nr:hypothetical protein [Actinomycetota bacterium]
MRLTHLVVKTGLMAALAACLQLFASFLPGPGHALGAFATLPIALIAGVDPAAGLGGLLVASGVVFMVQPLGAPILLFLSGPLGVVIGWGKKTGLPLPLRVLVGGVPLVIGMLIVTYVLGRPALGEFVYSRPALVVFGLYLVLALIYTWLWISLLDSYCGRLQRWLRPGSF